MKISIIGAGYVGLVSGACLADRGHDVTCIDVNQDKIDAINAGRTPIHEPGLEAVLGRTVGKRLTASADMVSAVENSSVTFIAVGTPASGGEIDLSQVEGAAREIGRVLRHKVGPHTVVVKSTVIPGTTDGLVRKTLEKESLRRAGVDFGLGMNPEFLTEGRAVLDFSTPDRIVIGGIDAATQSVLSSIYTGFEGVPLILVNNSTAEMIKYASNALLATSISFANEISRLCTRVTGVDAAEVMRGVHSSLYLTSRGSAGDVSTAPLASFLEAGCGFGGSCLPKDVTALTGQGRRLGLELPLLNAVLDVNRTQPDEVLRLVRKRYPDLAGVRVTVLGLAFKPDTDDIRESPAFPILARLRSAGAILCAYDPVTQATGHPAMQDVAVACSLEDALSKAQVVVIVTRWSDFERIPDLLKYLDKAPVVVDGRRMLDKNSVRAYEGIGL